MRRALVLAMLFPAVVWAQWHAPLDVRNHRTGDLAFLRLPPRAGFLLPGESSLSLSLVQANEFRRSGPTDEDAETLRPVARYRKGLEGGTELFVELPLIVRGGGFLDPIIEWWHDHVIQEHDPVRAATAKGRAHIEFPGSGGVYGDAFAMGDLTLGASRRLAYGLVASVALKAPTGNPAVLAGSGGIDLGLALDWRVGLGGPWTADLNGALIAQGRAARLEGTRPWVLASSVSVTYEANSRDAWTVQLGSEQAPTRTGQPWLDADHRVLSFGYQRRLDDGALLQLYFSEDGDFLGFSGGPTVGPDLTIAARLVKRL